MTEARRQATAAPDGRRAVVLIFVVLTLAVAAGLLRDEDFFLRGDFQNYHLGGYAEIARAMKAGELPLLTLTSWQAGALAGEYQFGVFSPPLAVLRLLLFSLDLPLRYLAAVFVWVHALVLALGAYLLARRRRLAPELALMVALASSLNGFMILWGVNWTGVLAGFTWLPWFWWALENAVERPGERRHVVAAGVFLAFVFTAGFVYGCLMALLVAAGVTGRLALARRPFAEALPVAWSLLIGLGLSSPAWLMLLEYIPSTMRVRSSWPLVPQTDFTVPLEAWLGTVLPTLKAPWRAPWLPGDDTASTCMHLGLAPVALLVAALQARRSELLRALRFDFLFLAVLAVLAASPGFGIFRWSFRWLPLLFLHATLLAAGAATELQAASPARPRSARPRFGRVAWLLVFAVSAYAVLVDGDRRPQTLWLSASLLAVASIWWGLEGLRGRHRLHRQLPWMVIPLTSFLAVAVDFPDFSFYHRRIEPRPAPAFDLSVTYLALYTSEQAFRPIRFPGKRFFPGNENMHSGVRLVNGYSGLGPAGTTRTFGFDYLGALREYETRPPRPLGPLLRRMAVDGLVAWPGSRELRDVPFEEFEVFASTPGATVYHRRGASTPRVQVVRRAFLAAAEEPRRRERSELPLLEAPGRRVADPGPVDYGEAQVAALVEGRNKVRLSVDARGTDRPVLLSFARPWFPGYRAYVDRRRAELLKLDRLMPAVEVPAGRRSEVLLIYRPASFVAGIVLVALTLAGIVAALALAARRPDDKRRAVTRTAR